MTTPFSIVHNLIYDNIVLDKKVLVNNLYCKYVVYSNFLSNSNRSNSVVDNYISIKKLLHLSKHYAKKKTLSGYTLNISSYVFKSKRNSACIFEMPHYTSAVLQNAKMNKINNAFVARNSPSPILLHSSVKGGFRVYSTLGFLGFLPRSQLKKILFQLNSDFQFVLLSRFYKNKFRLFWFLSKMLITKIRLFKRVSRRKLRKKLYSNFVFVYLEETKNLNS